MLLPEHRTALEALIDRAYDAISQPTEDVIDPATHSATRAATVHRNRAAAAETLATDIMSCIRVRCADQLRAYNREIITSRYQLPVELWVAVFEHLSQRDRISVSHVSHDWRKTALASAQLWRSPLFLSSTHATDCDCMACSDGSFYCRDCGRRCMHTSQPNPVDQVEAFLNRSGSLLIDLKMSIFPRAAASARTALREVIRPHIHRIESISFEISDIYAAQDFIESFDSFPALTSLTLDMESTSRTAWTLVQQLRLPTLRTLKLLGPLYCGEPFELYCPAVVSLTATFHHPLHIVGLLKACPSVQELLLKVGPRTLGRPAPEVQDTIEALLRQANPRVVHITKLYKVDVVAILALFGKTSIPTFKITCTHTERMEREDQMQFLCDEVQQPTRLECVRRVAEEGRTAFRLTISNATHERTYAVRVESSKDVEAVLDDLWGSLPEPHFQSIVQLRASSSLWPTLFHCKDDIRDSPHVTQAYIDIDGGDRLAVWLADRLNGITAAAERCLLRLEVLRFTTGPSHDVVRLDKSLAKMIENVFVLKSKLRLLELKGFTADGDLDTLYSIADEVRVL